MTIAPTCPQCNSEVDSDQIFCTSCGSMLDVPETTSPSGRTVGKLAPAHHPGAPAAAQSGAALPRPPTPVAPMPPAPPPLTSPRPAPTVPRPPTAPGPPGATAPSSLPTGTRGTPAPSVSAAMQPKSRFELPDIKPAPALAAALVAVAVLGLLIGVAGRSAGGRSRAASTAATSIESEDLAFDPPSSVSGPDTGASESDGFSEDADETATGGRPSTTSTPPTTLAEPSVGRWILVLESVPKPQSVDAAFERARQVGGGDPRVEVIDSDTTPGLNGGYWVVAVLDFSSRDAAVATCSSFGREVGGPCYPTRVGDGAR